MRKTFFHFLIVGLLLAACTGTSATPLVQPTVIQTTAPVAEVTVEPQQPKPSLR